MANPNPEAIIPPWLENLVKMQFFNNCSTHNSTCNRFCLNCYNNAQALCIYCEQSDEHNDHQILQIRVLSQQAVVRCSEIENVMDIRDVRTYILTSGYDVAPVVYLNERLQEGGRPNASPYALVCENCRTPFRGHARFCSLGCKNTMVAPRWLENLVNVQLPERCSTHVIMFCFDCNDGAAFCSNCRRGDERHNYHQVLQIKRFWNGGEYVVSASAIPPELSANLQRFKNGDDDDNVVFLQPSILQPFKLIPMPSPACEFCERTVNDDDARFCSLSCKLKIIRGRNVNNA